MFWTCLSAHLLSCCCVYLPEYCELQVRDTRVAPWLCLKVQTHWNVNPVWFTLFLLRVLPWVNSLKGLQWAHPCVYGKLISNKCWRVLKRNPLTFGRLFCFPWVQQAETNPVHLELCIEDRWLVFKDVSLQRCTSESYWNNVRQASTSYLTIMSACHSKWWRAF